MARGFRPSLLKNNKWNYEVDPSQSFVDQATEEGLCWRIQLAKATINTGASNGISFTTPAESVGTVYIAGFNFGKITGGITAQLREGDTLTGGSAATPRNLNRAWSATPDTGHGLTAAVTGFSASTGGILLYEDFFGGATAANRQPNAYTPDCMMKCKPATLYTLLLTADTGNTPTSAGIDLVILKAQ